MPVTSLNQTSGCQIWAGTGKKLFYSLYLLSVFISLNDIVLFYFFSDKAFTNSFAAVEASGA